MHCLAIWVPCAEILLVGSEARNQNSEAAEFALLGVAIGLFVTELRHGRFSLDFQLHEIFVNVFLLSNFPSTLFVPISGCVIPLTLC
jgi:hypothetical protein